MEPRRSGVKADSGGQRAARTVASDNVGIDERCSRGVSSTVAVPPAVASAALPSRRLIVSPDSLHIASSPHRPSRPDRSPGRSGSDPRGRARHSCQLDSAWWGRFFAGASQPDDRDRIPNHLSGFRLVAAAKGHCSGCERHPALGATSLAPCPLIERRIPEVEAGQRRSALPAPARALYSRGGAEP